MTGVAACRWTLRCLGLFALAACSVTQGARSSVPHAILDGQPDTSPAHRAVVATRGDLAYCTGTLIAPRFVLTAHHCRVARATVEIGFGNDISSPDFEWIPSDQQMSLCPSTDCGVGLDLAVLRLAWGPTAPVTPIPALPARLGLTPDDLGAPLTIVGFGRDDNDQHGVKRSLSAQLEADCDSCLPTFETISFLGGGSIMPGDSGGPWLFVRDGREYVAGVTSTNMIAPIVNLWEAEISAFMQGAPGQPCATPGDCETGACAAGVCCDVACDGPCMACNLPGLEGSCRPAFEGSGCAGGGVCSRGTCCDSACSGPCLACDLTGSVGTCRPVPEGHACEADDLCSTAKTCRDGVCRGTATKSCPPEDACHVSGGCEPATGQCRPSAVLPDGTSCPSRDACLEAGQCLAGLCVAGAPRTCAPVDSCHAAGTCDPHDGKCATGAPLDGTACEGGRCQHGICATSSGCQAAPGNPLSTALLVLGLLAALGRRQRSVLGSSRARAAASRR